MPLNEYLEGISLYFYHTVKVYSLLVPITCNCGGESFSESSVDFIIEIKTQSVNQYQAKVCFFEDSNMMYPLAGSIT
jgi:hypothetical protein